MKTITVIVVLLALVRPAAFADEIHVVTPHETIGNIVDEVGGDLVDTVVLSSGLRDPHYIPAKPSYITKTRKADLWIRFGMDLEIGYERLILEGSRNSAIQVGNSGHLDLSTNVLKLEVPTAHVDRSMGDVHPQGNPHYWLDPYNGRIMARAIADKLAELRPEHAETFIERGEAFVLRLDEKMFGKAAVDALGGDTLWQAELDGSADQVAKSAGVSLGGWYAIMKSHAGESLVSYHRTYTYFANRFDLKIPIELEPKPGIPPGPRHVLKVVQTIKEHDVSLIVQAPYYDTASAENAASRTDAVVKVVSSGVGGCENSTDYISFLDHVVMLFAEFL